ncbi:hypothetical protein AB9R04_05505 [Neisseria gonorrhoeae]
MKLEASKQKFKKSFIISLFFSILYTSPLLAVDYVYDNSKLTNEQIDRLKKNLEIKAANTGNKKLIF